jgi:agmatinase
MRNTVRLDASSLSTSSMTEPRNTSEPLRPFLDWPVVTDPSRWTGNVALLGVQRSEPYAKDSVPNDQARAPDEIRRLSFQFCDGPEHWDFDLDRSLRELEGMHPVDCGNMTFTDGDYAAFSAWQTSALRQMWRHGMQVILLGGDHGITIPAIEALDVLNAPVHILHIDAHLDWRDAVGDVRNGYSSPLRRASEKPWISGMTQIGLRGTGSARRTEVEAAREYGSHLYTAREIHRDGMQPVIDTLPEGGLVYVTIDADGLDPSQMPGVLGPSPGGLRVEQVIPLLHATAQKCTIVGLDVVEIAPSFDFENSITCITAGRLIINTLGASWRAGTPAIPNSRQIRASD